MRRAPKAQISADLSHVKVRRRSGLWSRSSPGPGRMGVRLARTARSSSMKSRMSSMVGGFIVGKTAGTAATDFVESDI